MHVHVQFTIYQYVQVRDVFRTFVQIFSLNMCQCRMCGDCMTGHFQVVITERHVKNLCCPNCQEPNIEDVTKETIYLEFLAVQVVNCPAFV